MLVLLCLIAPNVAASVLPMTDPAQYFAFRVFIGGAQGCLTTGTYDVQSLAWTQSGPCGPNLVFHGADGSEVHVDSFQARLAGQVDHDGHALGGVFTLFGAIPAMGIDTPSLLVHGSLIEASYAPPLLSDSGGGAIGPNALIDLDYALPAFGNAGDILLWQANALISGWSYPPERFPDQMPWHSSAGEGSYRNYTNTQYMIYDRSVFFAPEPATLVMLGLGLACLTWRRRM